MSDIPQCPLLTQSGHERLSIAAVQTDPYPISPFTNPCCNCSRKSAQTREAQAQQSDRPRVIGMLSDFSEKQMEPLVSEFRRQLRDLGWADSSIRITSRFGIANPAEFQTASSDIVSMSPDVIVTLSSPGLRAVKQATSTIPVVFTFVADPVAQGL